VQQATSFNCSGGLDISGGWLHGLYLGSLDAPLLKTWHMWLLLLSACSSGVICWKQLPCFSMIYDDNHDDDDGGGGGDVMTGFLPEPTLLLEEKAR
jgi:hypothetical protein